MFISPKSTRYKIGVSILFGCTSFLFSFHDITLLNGISLKITLFPGLVFPLLISLAWGWRYGVVTACTSGFQLILWGWYVDTTGIIFSFLIFIPWIVWHGYWANYRISHSNPSWLYSCFIVEIPFRIVSLLATYGAFYWVGSVNPAWCPIKELCEFLAGGNQSHIIKQTLSAYLLLFLAVFFLSIPYVRNLAGLPYRLKTKRPFKILGGAIAVGLGICLLREMIVYSAFKPTQADFTQISMWIGGGQGVFTGSLYILVSLAGGVFFNNILDERAEQTDQIRHLNRVLRAVQNVNKLITCEDDAATILHTACQLLVETRGYRTAWIAPTGQDQLSAFYKAGFHSKFNAMAEYLLEGNEPDCLLEVRTSPGVIVKNCPEDDCSGCPLSSYIGKDACMAARIEYKGTVYGTLVVSMARGFHMDNHERELLHDVAGDLGYALHTITIRRLRDRLAMAVHKSEDGVVMASRNYSIEYVNPAFCQQSEYTQEELLGKDIREMSGFSTDPEIFRTLCKKMDRGEPWQGTLVKMKKDCSEYLVEVSVNPFYEPDGTLNCFISSNRDVTNKLKLEEKVRKAQKLDSVGRMAGGIAHDINNLLTPILGFADLLRFKLSKDDPSQHTIAQILKTGMRSRNLINQLLSFARRDVMEFSPLVLSKVILDMELMLRKVLREDIRMLLNCKSNAMIMGDQSKIEQVIMNLVINAADAMPHGGMLVICMAEIELSDGDQALFNGLKPGRYLQIQMDDSGCGMNSETVEHIFEPFFTTKKQKNGTSGTGLGLATTYGIVKEHGGCINVYSEPDCGTTFSIFFPVCESKTVTDPVVIDSSEHFELFRDKIILLVEDEELVRESVHDLLDYYGLQVVEAASPRQALEIAEKMDHIDVLITDVIMPGMHGPMLQKELLKRFGKIKTLFMSGHTQNVITHSDILEKSCFFIPKPFTMIELKKKLGELIIEETS
jgi:PAS domain S-box-containing protein